MPSPNTLIKAQHMELRRLQGRTRARALRYALAAMERLDKELKETDRGSWNWASKRATMKQLQAAVSQLSRGQVNLLQQGLAAASRVSARGTAAYLTAMDKQYLGSVRPLKFDHVEWIENNAQKASKVRLREYRESYRRYGGTAVRAIEDEIGRAIMVGETWVDARKKVMDAVRDVVEDKQWMVDRITNTEMSAAVNGTKLEAMLAEDDPRDRMYKMLSAIFDDRTARDSTLLHGQKRPVDRPFVDVYPRAGKEYMAPPNRPRDREVVVPWRASWGELDDEPPVDPAPKWALEKHDIKPPKNVKRSQARRKAALRSEARDLKKRKKALERAVEGMPAEQAKPTRLAIEVLGKREKLLTSEIKMVDQVSTRLRARHRRERTKK